MFSAAVPKPTRGCRLEFCRRPSEMVSTLIGQMSDLLAPISKSTTRARRRAVPMGLCAVSRWCEGCRNDGKVQPSSALDRISERITLAFQTLSRPEAIRGATIGKQRFILYFNRIWRREWDSNPRYGFPHTRFPSVRLKPLGHLSVCLLMTGRDDFCKRQRSRRRAFHQRTDLSG
jgi:hypothetical protein